MIEPIPAPSRRELMKERYALEDAARALIRRIAELLGQPPEIRDEMRYLGAKSEVFFGGIEDLIQADPSDFAPGDGGKLRAFRRDTDSLFLARADLDRKLRDERRRAMETEEDVKVARANRMVDELHVEIARFDTPPHTP